MLFMLNQFSKFLKNTLNEQVLIQIEYYWWSQAGSNRRPPACKAGALPAELWPRNIEHNGNETELVGLGGFEPPTSPLSGVRSNQLSYRPKL